MNFKIILRHAVSMSLFRNLNFQCGRAVFRYHTSSRGMGVNQATNAFQPENLILTGSCSGEMTGGQFSLQVL